MWLYLITVNTQREAGGVHGTQLAQQTVITDSFPILLALLDVLLALCNVGCDHWQPWPGHFTLSAQRCQWCQW